MQTLNKISHNLLVLILLILPYTMYGQCATGDTGTIDWGSATQTWTSGTLTNTIPITTPNGETVNATITITPTGGGNWNAFGGGWPKLDPVSGYFGTTNALGIIWDPSSGQGEQPVNINITLDRAIDNLSFEIADIDNGPSAGIEDERQDEVVITSSSGDPTLTAKNGSPTFTISGNTATAKPYPNPTADGGTDNGTIVVDFPDGVTSVDIAYNEASGTNNPGPRGIEILGNFSLCAAQTGGISGQVTDVTNGGSQGVSGVTMELLDASGNPVLDTNNNPITTTTDENGNYTFSGLAAGTYQVREQQPSGYETVGDTEGDSTDNTISNIQVAVGSVNDNNNFQEQKVLDVTKTANVTNVEPGDTVTYTIRIDNNTGSEINNVTISDLLPSGLTYVTGSSTSQYPTGTATQSGTVTKTLSAAQELTGYYAGNNLTTTQSVDVTSADVPAGATIVSVEATTEGTMNGQALPSRLKYELTKDGSSIYTKDPLIASQVPQSWSQTTGEITTTGSALGTYSINWTYNDSFTTARVQPGTATVIIKWEAPGNRSYTNTPDVSSDNPASFVSTADNVVLLPNEYIEITYKAVVNSSSASELVNTVTANSDDTSSSTAAETLNVTPLPVTFVYFEGTSEQYYSILKWATSSEVNNLGFEVEKSKDGILYEKIGFVNGEGSTTKTSTYKFVDINRFSELTYYRLKQVDYDGTYDYSDVVVVSSEASTIITFPNPIVNRLYIKNAPKDCTYRIYNSLGSLLQSGNTENSIDVSKLARGSYIINITRNDVVLSSHIIIK